jgi:hypothetical protein
MDHDDYVWGYIDGGTPTKKITYKVWWDIAIKHTTDGYFYKSVPIQKGFKYTDDHWQAKQILEKVNDAIQLLGLADKATTGILEEES